VRRNAALALAAAAGAAVGALIARRRAPAPPAEPVDPRALELRRKLSEARAAPSDEDDFEAAGMGAETIVEDEPRAEKRTPASPRGPGEEFEAMRRRVHEEARAAAEEMRRTAE
jgi:hypothetical protein